MDIQYREVTSHDIAELAKIRAAEWESEEYWIRRISGYLNCELHPQHALLPRIIYVAIDADKIVGFIAGHLSRRFQCDGELQWINVIPNYRRKGIAQGLLQQLANWFITHRAFKICVNGSGPFYSNSGAKELNKHWMIWDNIRQLILSH
jgi:GNAT superfamily N-acetyltransferase